MWNVTVYQTQKSAAPDLRFLFCFLFFCFILAVQITSVACRPRGLQLGADMLHIPEFSRIKKLI